MLDVAALLVGRGGGGRSLSAGVALARNARAPGAWASVRRPLCRRAPASVRLRLCINVH